VREKHREKEVPGRVDKENKEWKKRKIKVACILNNKEKIQP
jgi:hypothetical protein